MQKREEFHKAAGRMHSEKLTNKRMVGKKARINEFAIVERG